MPETIFPPRLQSGDQVRVIAPANSLSIIGEKTRQLANYHLGQLGLHVTYGEHAEEIDAERSSSIASRVSDIHAAFADPDVKGIFSAIGGYNSNQILNRVDWDLLRANPKVLCGFSDITALQHAGLARAGLVTYSGPHYSTFGQKHLDPYTVQSFRDSVFSEEPYLIEPSNMWTDDLWYLDQDNRNPLPNEGHWVLQAGKTSGTAIGGNLCTFILLQGTNYMPNVQKTVLFVEDTAATNLGTFDRQLQAILHGRIGGTIGGLVIGRFQQESDITAEQLRRVVTNKPVLASVPIIANVDFGHTEPRATFPIGGIVGLEAEGVQDTRLRVITH